MRQYRGGLSRLVLTLEVPFALTKGSSILEVKITGYMSWMLIGGK